MGNDTPKLSTTDIAQMVGLESVTIRKYAIALEKAGYNVQRSEAKHREFTESDAMVFQQLKALRERSGLSVEVAAKAVAAKHQGASESVAVVPQEDKTNEIMQYEERYTRLQEIIERQADELNRVHERLDQQNANISIILREVLETRRMVAAAGAKRWWQFWKKDLTDFHDGPDPEAQWKRKEEIKNGQY